MHYRNLFAATLLAAAPVAAYAHGDFDFDHFHADNVAADVIEAAIGATSTAGLDGIALAPGNSLYVLHADEDENKTIFLLDPPTDSSPANITVLATDAELKADLGITGTIIIEGGFTSSPDRETLYFFYSDSEDLNFEIHLVAFDQNAVSPDPKAVSIFSGEEIEEVKDADVLANGNIVLALDDDGVGILDMSTTPPTFTTAVTDADFVNDLINNHGFPPSTDEGEAESIAVHPITGDVYVFLHEVEELYRISDIETAPTLTRVVVPEWVPGDPASLVTNAVDMHGMVFDSEGNLYGFDEGNEAIVIWDGDHGFVILLDDIDDELHHHHKHGGHGHGDFEPAEYRGLAVRINSEGHPVLYMAMNNDDDGVVIVEFDDEHEHTSVNDWNMFQ